jgi:hypothetical protein
VATFAELEARREARRQAHIEAHETQRLLDLERLDALEEEHGYGRVLKVELGTWRDGSGAATMMVLRLPLASEAVFKRFQQQVSSGKASPASKLEAAEVLARSCVVYPHPKSEADAYNATVEMAPGVLGNLALQIVSAVQGRAEAEGK